MFAPRPPRWRARILYSLAFVGFLALSGLTMIIYAALQVPETDLEAAIPFPKMASPYEKIEAIPNVTASTQAKPSNVGGEPAYAYFYTNRPNEAEQSKVTKLRSRPRSKAMKRTTSPTKSQKSS